MAINPKAGAGKAPSGKMPSKDETHVHMTDSQKKRRRNQVKSQPSLIFKTAVRKMAKNGFDEYPHVSTEAAQCLSAIMFDIMERVAACSGSFCKKVGRQTVTMSDVMAAFKIIMTGELMHQTVEDIKTTCSKPITKSSK
ncbi:Histone H2B [Astathelohania contejeani]|uniref:Histone H2B n=1 Tax=Astathelohania contejeani TaxID=164912 RepID=A0ABQ7I2F6_9MICR|nr:Histone H2B [Thelohania contejeani]